MSGNYRVGRAYGARIDGHGEPVPVVSIEADGMNAGGGIMLIANRGDGEIERIVSLLNLDLRALVDSAETAMSLANRDGAEFDLLAELGPAKEALQVKGEGLKS